MGMTLDDYLRTDGVSAKALAAELHISEASLSRIRRGEQNITRETIRQIVEATAGAVTADDLVFHVSPVTADVVQSATGQAGQLSGGPSTGSGRAEAAE